MTKLRAAALVLAAGMLAGAAAPDMKPTCDPRDDGARGDGVTLDTLSIQRAVDRCAARGGGRVILRGGTFLSGTIVLADRITLDIAAGATLLASPRIADYRPFPAADVPKIFIDGSTQNKGNGPYHLIHAEHAVDVAIVGRGTIAGNGQAFWDADPERTWVARRARPSPLIEFVATRGVRVAGITIRDAPGWTIHPLESSRVTIRDVTIRNDPRGPNTDAINIDSSSDVTVDRVDVIAGDDCVVLKTTGRRGIPPPSTQRVQVRDVRCSSDDQGIKIGTESTGDFSDILFDRILIYRAPGMYRPPTAAVSLSMVDGAAFRRVRVSNVDIRDAVTPLFLRLGNRGRGQRVATPGTLAEVTFSEIRARGGTLASSITGLPGHPVHGVTLRNIDIVMAGGQRTPASGLVPEVPGDYPHAPMFGALPATGLYTRHVAGLTLRNVRLRTAAPDVRPALLLDDVVSLQADPVSRRSLRPGR